MSILLLTLIAAMALGTVLTWLAGRVAVRLDLLDHPDQGRKRHQQPIPLMGGVAVLLSLLLVVAGLYLAMGSGWVDAHFTSVHLWLFVSAVGFCGIGLYDDKRGLRPRTKFLLQLIAALPFVMGGRVITEFGILGQTVHLGAWGVPVTLFWLALCVNSVNLLDGLDGVAGTVGVVVSGTVCIIALMAGQGVTALIAMALAGSLLGFLVHNWHPAKIFLGDSGSLTVGFLLGALAIEGSLKTATGLTLAAPLVLMSIPGFDTAMAVLRRLLNGRGIGQGDRAHLHHCLKDHGLSVDQIAAVIGLMCLSTGASVVAAARFQNDWFALAGCLGMVVLLVGGRIFGHHEVRLLWQHLRHLTASSGRAARVIHLQTVCEELQSRRDLSPYQAWDLLCEFVEEHDGRSLEFYVQQSATGPRRTCLAWSRGESVRAPAVPGWEFQLTIASESDLYLGVGLRSAPSAPLAQFSADHLCQLVSAYCALWSRELLTRGELPDTAADPQVRGRAA